MAGIPKPETFCHTTPLSKEEIASSLELMEGKLMAVKEALALLDKRCGEISDHQQAVETEIHDTVGRLHETLDVRKTELISNLYEVTQRKLKDLAVQRDQMETILAQLSSCLESVRESLKISTHGEVLMMKTNMVKLISPFQSDSLKPNREADMKFVPSQDMISRCQTYGRVFSAESPDPFKCQATGKGLEVAVVGKKSTAILEAINLGGEPCCMGSIHSLQCELVSEITGATERGNFEHKGQNLYEISYQPTIKGKHQLCIKVEDTHIRGSPFAVTAKLPVEKLGTPILTIDDLKKPSGVVVNQRGEVVVAESGKHCISIFSPSGEKLQSFGTQGSGQGQFESPQGVTVDGAGNILVVDTNNHRIQKFTVNGQFLSAIGTKGKKHLKFYKPTDVAFNAGNNKVYVVDWGNNRIQVLNSDLSFCGTFGKEGDGKGCFGSLGDIACDSTGKVYVVDSLNNCIQVFTDEGRFLKRFGEYGCGQGELKYPWGIAIDDNDLVYISEFDNHRISVFISEGQFMTSFGRKGNGRGEFEYPSDMAVGSSGVLYVCDDENNRVQAL